MDEAPEDPPAADGLLTQKQFAEQRGWSKQYVNQLVKQGKIPLTDGLIDPAAADAALARNRDPSRQGRFRADGMSDESEEQETPIPAGAPRSFVRARTVRENYRALRERAEYQMMIGGLVNYREVEAAGHEAGAAVRECVQKTAADIAAKIASQFNLDTSTIETIVCGFLNDALVRAGELLTREIQDIQKGNRYYEDATID